MENPAWCLSPTLLRTLSSRAAGRTDSSGKPLEDEAIVRNAELKNAEISKDKKMSVKYRPLRVQLDDTAILELVESSNLKQLF